MLRFLTAGESHGPSLTVIIEGMPAGLPLNADAIASDLARRQLGYGRGRRMTIEQDRAEIQAGVRHGETLGSPIALVIRNRDWTNWQHTMSIDATPPDDTPGARRGPVTRPRPGHADLAGGLKYGRTDLRDVLERASARETAARVAAGAVARVLLRRYGIETASHVVAIADAAVPDPLAIGFDQVRALPADDDVREAGDTAGGCFEVIAHGVPPGLGSYVQWDRKLDGRLAQAFMSIPAIKAVGIGRAAESASRPGSQMHDEILPAEDGPSGSVPGLRRPTNNAGGLEGGVTNGEDVRVTAWMKPISTLMKPLRSVDLQSMTVAAAAIERSDVCAVPAAAVVGEAVACLVLADALLDKLGGDSISELDRAWERLHASLAERLARRPEPV
jgi:chorismate synthase